MTASFLFLLSAVPFYGLDPGRYNYTGLLHLRSSLTLACMIPAGLFYTFLFYQAGCRKYPKRDWAEKTLLLFGMTAVVMALPYGEKEDFFSGLHVLFAYGALIVYGWLMTLLLHSNRALFTVFVIGMTLSFFLALSALSVSGYSELAFSAMNALIFSFLIPLSRARKN